MSMRARLHKRLQSLEKRLAPPPGRDLRYDIKIRAMAEAFRPDQLESLQELADSSGHIQLPPEMAGEWDQSVELCDRLSLQLTGKSYAELRGDEIPRGEMPFWL